MIRCTYYFVFVLIIFSFSASAQEYIQTTNFHYNLEKGLETRNIRSTFKDSRGFMWICTDVGVYRFDGFEFRPYQRNRINNVPLSVERVAEDAENNLWFQHFDYNKGVIDFSILTNNSDTLIAIKDYPNIVLPFPLEDALNIFSPTGIWLSNKKTNEIFEYQDGRFEKIGKFPSPTVDGKINPRFFIDKDSAETNWLFFDGILYKAIPGIGYQQYEVIPKGVMSFTIDEHDKFWFIYGDEIYVKENQNAPFVKPAFLNNLDVDNIHDFKIESINGQFIIANIGTVNEMLLINYHTNDVIPIKFPLKDKLVKITPSHVLVDKENTIWVSTYEGVFQMNFQKNNFKKLLQGKSTRGIIRGNNGNLWISSYTGLFEIDKDSKKENLINSEIIYGQGAYLDTKNNYWLGGSMYSFHKIKSSSPFEVELQQIDGKKGTIFNFYEHKNDPRLWAGGEFGLYVYNEEKRKFLPYESINNFPEISQSAIYDFEPIDETNFLIASTFGVYQLDINKGIINHYCSANNSLAYDFISYIHKDQEDGTLWLGTKMGGLFHWEFPHNKPKRITTKEGLADNTIYAIYEDKFNKGYLWLPSNNGLMHFNKQTREVTNYKTTEGIVHDEFNFQSNYEDADGTLYFGGIQGVTSFHPKDFDVSKQRPVLHLTSLSFLETKGNKEITDLQSFKEGKTITLGPKYKSVKISAALASYENPSACKYFYKVDNESENNWLPMDENSILINGLSSGQHNIYIKAKNDKGIWAENEIKIPIKMLPPFYMRWWFLLLMMVVLFGLVTLFIKRRTYVLEKDKQNLEMEVARRTQEIEDDKRVIEKQAQELQQLDEIKSRFFTNVTHELRTPLTLIIGPLQQLIKQLVQSDKIEVEKVIKTLKSIAANGNQLKQLVEEILDLNRLDAKKIVLNKAPVQLRNAFDKWVNNFTPEADNRNIQFKFVYDTVPNLHLNLDVQKLERIVVNLLSNAFKYSEGGDTIYLRVSEEANQMKIEVEDTGLGIHENDLPHIFQRFYQTKQAENNLMGGLGIGLALSKELASLMKGEIFATSEIGKGSTFTFIFPKEKVEGIVTPVVSPSEKPIAKVKEEIKREPKRKNILIVEDNLQMLEFVSELLDPFVNIQTANNGKTALLLLKKEVANFDLIISDVMMPEMDGFTFLESLREIKKWQLTPVVFLTARANILDKIKAFTIGVDDYMIKPFEPDELVARIKNLVEKNDIKTKIEKRGNEEVIVISDEHKDKKKAFELINELKETDSVDFRWLKEVEQVALNNIEKSNFNVAQFAFHVHLGERQLGRRLKKLTGMTPGNYLKEVRLQTARHLIENRIYSTVSEVSFKVGFTTPEYFSRIFKKRFGKLPTDHVKKS